MSARPLRLRLIEPTRLELVVGLIAATGLLVSVLAWRVGGFLFGIHISKLMIDLQVYRRAGRAVVADRSIYATRDGEFPFTYPPFAALFAVVVGFGSRQLIQILWTIAQLVVLASIIFATLRRRVADTGFPRGTLPLLIVTLAAVAAISATQPIYENYFYGQVNIFLMALCFFDVVAPPTRRSRGALVGIAAAVKLVPGLFGLYFLVTGQIRAAVVSFVSFLCCGVVALIALPSDSKIYWLHIFFDTARIGSPTFHRNQSLYGVALRAASGTSGRLLFAVLAVAVLLLGLRRARELHRDGDELAAGLAVGLVGILISPISWTHHLDWVGPVLVLLLCDPRSWWYRGAGAAALIVFSCYLPRDAALFVHSHTGWWRVLGGLGEDGFAFLVLALLFLPFTGRAHHRDSPRPVAREPGQTSPPPSTAAISV